MKEVRHRKFKLVKTQLQRGSKFTRRKTSKVTVLLKIVTTQSTKYRDQIKQTMTRSKTKISIISIWILESSKARTMMET